jgi:hypothetical protein
MRLEMWGRTAAAKRLLLGSAAGIFAVSAVQAADQDFPVKAKPVEYVKVCSLYGAGFWYVPGTDTCIKIGAYTKLDTMYNAASSGAIIGGSGGYGSDPGGSFDRTTNEFQYRNRNDVSFDMRTQTEYGTLRSYIDIGSQIATNSLQGPTGAPGGGGLNAASSIYVTRAFLQFAGITAGRMRSFFDMVFTGTYALAQQRFSGDTSPNGIVGAAYTWQFGGGLSATISLEDGGDGQGGHGRSTVNLASGFTPPAASNVQTAFGLDYYNSDIKGTQMFDPIFNIRLDQAWGFVGFSAALHDASGGYYGSCASVSAACPAPSFTTSGHPADVFGYALSAAFSLNNVFGMAGDTMGLQAVFTKGAVGYATSNYGAQLQYGAGNNVGMGWMVDGIYTNGSQVELTQVWSFEGAYEHIWNPKWRTSIYGGMQGTSYDSAATAMICPGGAHGTPSPVGFSNSATIGGPSFGGAFIGGVTNCSPNWSSAQVGTRTMWNPVPDIDIGFDVSYYHMNTAFAGSAVLPGFGTQFVPGWYSRAPGTYQITNQDQLAGFFRIQRNFLY